jgi:hypothetical protein
VQIKEKGMSLDLVNCFWLLTCLSKCLRHDQEKRKSIREELAKSAKPAQPVVHRTVRWRTGQCPVAHRTVSGAPGWPSGELAALGNRRGDVAKIHRTVRWYTGLSGESSAPAPKYIGDELIALGKRRKRRVYKSPDCPVVHRTVQ